MCADRARKQEMLEAWWAPLLPRFSARLLDHGAPPDAGLALRRLSGVPGCCPTGLTVYILFAEDEGRLAPVYVGKADDALARWGRHLCGWKSGRGSYAAWR